MDDNELTPVTFPEPMSAGLILKKGVSHAVKRPANFMREMNNTVVAEVVMEKKNEEAFYS